MEESFSSFPKWGVVALVVAGVAATSGCGVRIRNLNAQLASLGATVHVQRQLAVGGGHACFVDSDGSLRCWGENSSFQSKSRGAFEPPTVPGVVPASALPNVSLNPAGAASIPTTVSAGRMHACVLTSGGAVKCWGDNSSGQIGTGFTDAVRPQNSLYTVIASGATAVSAGGQHTCAVVSAGLQCWGSNFNGQIGNGASGGNVLTPYMVFSSGVTAVSAGSDHTCAIVSGGLQCWGWNSEGQIGNGASGGNVLTPYAVFPSGVTAVAAGIQHTCALISGSVQCWGDNGYSQIGHSTSGSRCLTPFTVISSGVTAIAAGAFHTCALVSDSLRCWGRNWGGELGDGSTLSTAVPYTVFSSGVTAFSTGGEHTCAVVSGDLYCWGGNQFCEVGNGSCADYYSGVGKVPSPYLVPLSGVIAIAAGYEQTMAIVSGKVWQWGMWDGSTIGAYKVPTEIAGPNFFGDNGPYVDSELLQAVSATDYTCVVGASGSLQCWGKNSTGQIGNGASGASVLNPYTVFSSGVTAVAAGVPSHTCAVVSGGLYCWGYNYYGEVGNGTAGASVLSPRQVFSSGVTAVAVGYGHTCAVVSGSLQCWGANDNGQIGNGVTSGYPVLNPFTAFSSGVTAAAAGASMTCAVVSGSLQCWGDNSYGQVGNGSGGTVLAPFTVFSSGVTAVAVSHQEICAVVSGSLQCWGGYASSTPQTVISSGVTAVAVSDSNTCAVVSGSLQCWGMNSYGEVGNGDPGTSVSNPFTVFASGVTAVAVGEGHTCAIVSGKLRCWGRNNYGQLGDGTTVDETGGGATSVPVPETRFSAGVTKVATGTNHTCAVVSGSLKCWGGNDYGQIGDGGAAMKVDSPYTVFSSGVTDVVAGYYHTCALVSDSLRCWGANLGGETGEAATIGGSTLSPYTVFSSDVLRVFSGLVTTCALKGDGTLWCFGYKMGGNFNDGDPGAAMEPTPTRIPLPSGTLVDLSFGFQHACAILEDVGMRKLYCWGSNASGEIKDDSVYGSGLVSELVLASPTLERVVVGVSAGLSAERTCYVDGGILSCRGENGYGQIDPNTSGEILSPFAVAPSSAAAASTGGFATCALVGNDVRCTGTNVSGILGAGIANGTTGASVPILTSVGP